MSYAPPSRLPEVLARIDFDEALQPDDPRYVETQAARGAANTLEQIARKFGLWRTEGYCMPPSKLHVLLFGHTGSGKTTQLRHYAQELRAPGRFFVIEVNIIEELDPNNAQYADILLAMARQLLESLQTHYINIASTALEPLERWFDEHVRTQASTQDFTAQVDAGASAKGGMPFLIHLFAKFTSSFKTNVSYKDELRRVVRNSYSQFSDAFNAFLLDAETALKQQGHGERVLFLVDGTDKLRREDTQNLFIYDAEQLAAVNALVLYTVPLWLAYEGSLGGRFDRLRLPMIKLQEQNGAPFDEGVKAMRDILLKRAARSLFASEAEIERLIASSGGHPRELLRLLKLCCELTESSTIDASTVANAVQALGSDYRRFLDREDYQLLAQLDRDGVHSGNDDRTRKLLYDSALLEYNDGKWRRSHPVVRLLEGYSLAEQSLGSGTLA